MTPDLGPLGPEQPYYEPRQPEPQSALMEPPPAAATSGINASISAEVDMTDDAQPEPETETRTVTPPTSSAAASQG